MPHASPSIPHLFTAKAANGGVNAEECHRPVLPASNCVSLPGRSRQQCGRCPLSYLSSPAEPRGEGRPSEASHWETTGGQATHQFHSIHTYIGDHDVTASQGTLQCGQGCETVQDLSWTLMILKEQTHKCLLKAILLLHSLLFALTLKTNEKMEDLLNKGQNHNKAFKKFLLKDLHFNMSVINLFSNQHPCQSW